MSRLSRPPVLSHTDRSICSEKVKVNSSPWTESFGRSGFERNYCLIKLIRTGSQRNTMQNERSSQSYLTQMVHEPKEQIGLPRQLALLDIICTSADEARRSQGESKS
jgi:hypothetical protein